MPAWGNFVLDKGYKVDAAVTKFRFVKQGAAEDSCTPVTAATDFPLGVAQFSVSAGELALKKDVAVRMDGISECECSAAVTRGSPASMASDGRVKNAATGERVVGQILATGSGAGVRVPVKLTSAGHLSA